MGTMNLYGETWGIQWVDIYKKNATLSPVAHLENQGVMDF